MKKELFKLIFVMLLAVSPAFAAEPVATASVAVKPAETASATVGTVEMANFPLVIKGTEVLINRASKQEELEAKLTGLLGEKVEMEEKNRLQYGFQVNEETAPMTIFIDWDKDGKIELISLDAMMEEQNPIAKELSAWLNKNAGAGKPVSSDDSESTTTAWEYNGWTFTFNNGGDGEDSSYSFEITPLAAK